MSLLNGGKGRDNDYDSYWHNRFQKQGQWNSDEKQKTGRFVGDGVREETFLVHHHGGNLVDDFDDDDCSAPEPKPMGKDQDRDQLYAAADHKHQIRKTVHHCPRFAFAVELPCQKTISHIAQSAGEIYYPKGDTSHIEEEETESAKEPEGCYEVWAVFHFTIKFATANTRWHTANAVAKRIARRFFRSMAKRMNAKQDSYCFDGFLQCLEKASPIPTVHLHVVELERDGQQRLEPAFAVFAPHHHRVEELVSVLVDDAVELGLDHRGGADNHIAVEEATLALFRHFGGQRDVVAVELLQVVGEGDVAGVDPALAVAHHHIDGDLVVAEELAVLGQQMQFLSPAGGLPDAPAHQRVELDAALPAGSQQFAHIHRLYQRHHRHRCRHPHLEGECSRGIFRVDFVFHFLGI